MFVFLVFHRVEAWSWLTSNTQVSSDYSRFFVQHLQKRWFTIDQISCCIKTEIVLNPPGLTNVFFRTPQDWAGLVSPQIGWPRLSAIGWQYVRTRRLDISKRTIVFWSKLLLILISLSRFWFPIRRLKKVRNKPLSAKQEYIGFGVEKGLTVHVWR